MGTIKGLKAIYEKSKFFFWTWVIGIALFVAIPVTALCNSMFVSDEVKVMMDKPGISWGQFWYLLKFIFFILIILFWVRSFSSSIGEGLVIHFIVLILLIILLLIGYFPNKKLKSGEDWKFLLYYLFLIPIGVGIIVRGFGKLIIWFEKEFM